ncbi:MAG: EamA family transporter [Rhodospirillales bacterium 20-60-12]|nr:MAG: EamA family transporter [Rhodospirillales bacterium 20-60-12]HQT66100.1 EamA family transporter [Acetobacteraceae bacterium]
MTALWIPITIAAAICQTWRTALQQKLRGELSASAAGFVRFLYALPADALFLLGAAALTGTALAPPPALFLLYCTIGGVAQISGTILLIKSFGYRNFVVGSAYAKTEAAQIALIMLVLGVSLPALSVIGIIIAVAGVLSLSFAGRALTAKDLLAGSVQPAALCGLGAGFSFAVTAIFLRMASQALPPHDPVVVRGLMTLLATNLIQTILQGLYMAATNREELYKTALLWRRASWIGLASAIGSGCWFIAFAMTNVALVRGVGQIEIIFTFAVSKLFLHETLKKSDLPGLAIVTIGVILIAA